MIDCPWLEHRGKNRDVCLLQTIADGQELVYCDQVGRVVDDYPGPFLVAFDISNTTLAVAQVFAKMGDSYKLVKELVGDDAIELRNTLKG